MNVSRRNLLAVVGFGVALTVLAADAVRSFRNTTVLIREVRRAQEIHSVHEKIETLYAHLSDAGLARIDFAESVTQMVTELYRTYPVNPKTVRLKIAVRDVTLSVEAAIPCGLLINELVSNALKHAFPAGRKGELRIEMGPTDSGQCRLVVADNGIGLPAELDIRRTESLGLQRVCTRVEQLGGRMELDRQDGTCFRITFAEPHYGPRG